MQLLIDPDNPGNPANPDGLRRLVKDLPVINALAEHSVEQELGMKSLCSGLIN
jgi:hypothetical protein